VGRIFEQGVSNFKNKKYQECINTMNLVLMIDPGNREAEIYREKAGKRAKAVSAIR
jgi:antibiotic biosynthesis monooxygenase (ABM) superfamily enzyme